MESNSQPSGEAQKLPEKKAWYKKRIKKRWAIGLIIFFFILIVGGSSDEKKKDDVTKEPAPIAQEQSVPVPQESEAVIAYKNLETYDKSGQEWKNIMIPAETSQEDLIKLAKQIHKKDPNGNYHIFNDDAKFQQYKDWDINYGKVKDTDGKVKTIDECLNMEYCRKLIQEGKYAYPYPEEWKSHEIGLINKMLDFDSKQMKWTLSTPMGEKISDL
ncbi:MAG: hypothetical protein ACSLEX_01350 [Minisyncoccota bacterium]